MTRFLALLVLSAALLGGCGIEKFQSQVNAAAAELEQKTGSKPFPGWRSYNGVLVEVNFTFEASEVAKYPIGELEKLAREAAEHHITPPPQRVNVSVQRGVAKPLPPGSIST